jgi:hypothetical protein
MVLEDRSGKAALCRTDVQDSQTFDLKLYFVRPVTCPILLRNSVFTFCSPLRSRDSPFLVGAFRRLPEFANSTESLIGDCFDCGSTLFRGGQKVDFHGAASPESST